MESSATQTVLPRPFRLSPEVVMHIMRYVNPIDIISMRKTCRPIYDSSKLRTVWVATLERVCESHGIFKPTYPMEKMSLPDLEHAALAPYRIIKLLKAKNLEVPLEPYQTRIFRCRQPNLNRQHHPFGVHLVPGGRFVLTHNLKSLHLWDLGYNVNVPIKPHQTASVNTLWHHKICAVGASSDGQAIVFAAIFSTRLRIFEIRPQDSRPEFRSRSDLLVRNRNCIVQPRGDTAYIWDQSYFVVWNWVDGIGCRWNANSSNLSPQSMRFPPRTRSHRHLTHTQFYVCKSSIICCGAQGFYIWDVPSFHSFPPPPSQCVDELTLVENPVKTFPLPNQGRTVFSRSSWERTGAGPFNHHLCFLDPNSPNEQLSLYSIRHIGRIDDSFLPTFIPVSTGKSSTIYGDCPYSTTTSWLDWRVPELMECDDHLVFCSMSRPGALVTTVIPIPKSPSQAVIQSWSKVLTAKIFNGSIQNPFGFCPISGRIVHLSGPEGDTKLHISDLLSIADSSP